MLLWATYFLLLATASTLGTKTLSQLLDELSTQGLGLPIVTFIVATSIPVAIGIANYTRQVEIQRAALLRELTTKLFTDQRLYDIYNDLIYSYTARTYRQLAAAVETAIKQSEDVPAEPIFAGSAPWQQDATGTLLPGRRRYHPFFFKGSPEEARLDAFLSYLDLIAFHIDEGHLTFREVESALSDVFAVVANKPFITEYLLYTRGGVRLADRRQTHSEDALTASSGRSAHVSVLNAPAAANISKLYRDTLYVALEGLLDRFRLDMNEGTTNDSTLDFRLKAIEMNLRERNKEHELFDFPPFRSK